MAGSGNKGITVSVPVTLLGREGGYTEERVDEALGERRRKQVAEYREQRDNGAVRTALEALTAAAAGTDNLMPKILAAVKAESTVGEVADAMRTVFGEYQERLVL